MLSSLLIGLVLLILFAAALAPLESLGWYAGWYQTDEVPDAERMALAHTAATAHPAPQADAYVVYLSGIGAIAGDSIPDEEWPFLERLAARIPHARLTHDVFPYSVTNTGLTVQRIFARLWQWIERYRIAKPNGLLPFLINLRNLLQVLVSADKRYGPVMNYGLSRAIIANLHEHGYDLRQRKPIVVIGSSGGGQMAVGAALFLRHITGAPIYVISLGGVIASDPGLDAVEHLYHLYGSHDSVQALSDKVFPGRWPWATGSEWHRAVADGRITMHNLGPLNHNLQEHYFDDTARLPDGTTYLNATVDAIGAIVDTLQHGANGASHWSPEPCGALSARCGSVGTRDAPCTVERERRKHQIIRCFLLSPYPSAFPSLTRIPSPDPFNFMTATDHTTTNRKVFVDHCSYQIR